MSANGRHLGPRWWNAGRYEQECAAFDASQPLSREVWESLQKMHREEFERMCMEPILHPDPFPLHVADAFDIVPRYAFGVKCPYPIRQFIGIGVGL